eukprot:m.225432 g.225432  ORF g.225432 m.225432 type:complete len:104 (+) comp17041_c0_seq5:883-1194(+)
MTDKTAMTDKTEMAKEEKHRRGKHKGDEASISCNFIIFSHLISSYRFLLANTRDQDHIGFQDGMHAHQQVSSSGPLSHWGALGDIDVQTFDQFDTRTSIHDHF